MGMAYVQEIVVQPPRLGNKTDSIKCGIHEDEIPGMILPSLKGTALPAFALIDAPAISQDKARIYLLPEVTTMEVMGRACVSYISLIATSQASLPIPPVEIPRNVTVTYWQAGVMLNSSAPSHKRTLETGFEKLATYFSRDYRLAQTPDLPWLKNEKKEEKK
jgi:hypothetical protein